MAPSLDPYTDVVALTAALVDFPSESHHELLLADEVERQLAGLVHLEVVRIGNTVVARTQLGHAQRVLLGGHLDTVSEADNGRAIIVRAGELLPVVGPDGATTCSEDRLYGLGSSDMKGGVAVMLRLAAQLTQPRVDLTFVFYDCEEVASEHNGLEKLAATFPDLLNADLAILMEPSEAGVEAGCQGTLRAEIRVTGRRAHSARGWLGENAVHVAGEFLARLSSYEARSPVIDGLQYREGMNAVGIRGGVAGNVIPDECVVTVNYRFAPDRSVDEAEREVRAIAEGFEVRVVDNAAGALPHLDLPLAAQFVAAVGTPPRPKYGWTDVARFAAAGIPAVNFGPGSPNVAHARHECVPLADLHRCENVLREWLQARE